MKDVDTLIGAIIGDIVGSCFEFNNNRSKAFDFFNDDSFVTDDTIMSIAIAKAILETGKSLSIKNEDYYSLLENNTIKYMQEIGRKYPSCGYGGRFYEWMFSDNPKPYNSYGNGAAMRVSSVAWIAKDESELKFLSQIVTGVTHNHPEGIKGAEAIALAIFLSKEGYYKQEIKARIEKDYYELNFSIDEIRESYEFNETCQDTVPQALQAFFESVSFEDAIRTAISIGGDSDTLAAITGSIAEAYYGVPDHLKQEAISYLDENLKSLYQEWNNYISQDGRVSRYHVVIKYIPMFESNLLGDDVKDVYDLPKEYSCFFTDLWSVFKSNGSSINHDTLIKLNIEWKEDALKKLDLKLLDEYDLIYLMTRLHSTERIHGGTVVNFIKSGHYLAWLMRLKSLSNMNVIGGK